MIRRAYISDVKQIAKVCVDTWRTAYKGIISQEYLQNLNYESREKRFRQILEENNVFMNVYQDDKTNEIIGFISFGLPLEDFEFEIEIYSFYILDNYQMQGIGKQLLHSAVDELEVMGKKTMILWVLKDNIKAIKFYEKMGGKFVKEKIKNIGNQDIIEYAYIFDLN